MAEGKASSVSGTPTLFVVSLESLTEARVLYRFSGVPAYDAIEKSLNDAMASKVVSIQ
jgi:hypothetical protein